MSGIWERFWEKTGSLPVRLLRPLAAGKGRRTAALAPHQWFLAVGWALLPCVPHAFWNNLYGVLFAAAALILYWWDCAAEEKAPFSPARLGPGVWIFLAMCLLCTLWAIFKAASLRVALFYLAGFALAYVTAAAFREKRAAGVLMGGQYAAVLFTAVYGLAAYFLRGESYTVPIGGVLVDRLCSTLEHAINYSEYLALLLPLCLVWALGRKKTGARIALSAALLIPCAALLLTYARTGWISLALALAVLLWYRDKRLLIPAALLGVLALVALPGSLQARFLSMLHPSDAASSGRFTLWKECLGALREHWLAGVGLGPENFYHAYLPHSTGVLPFQPPHANMGYLEIFLSTGVVGFAAFLCFFFGIFFRLGRAARRAAAADLWPLRALTAALAGAALGNLPEHIWFYPRVLFLWCMVFGLALAAAEEGR